MAQRTETSRKRGSGAPQLKGNSTGTGRSKAQQAASKTKDELRVEKRNYLILRPGSIRRPGVFCIISGIKYAGNTCRIPGFSTECYQGTVRIWLLAYAADIDVHGMDVIFPSR